MAKVDDALPQGGGVSWLRNIKTDVTPVFEDGSTAPPTATTQQHRQQQPLNSTRVARPERSDQDILNPAASHTGHQTRAHNVSGDEHRSPALRGRVSENTLKKTDER